MMSRLVIASACVASWMLIHTGSVESAQAAKETSVVVVNTTGPVKPKFVKAIRKRLNGALKSQGIRPVGPKRLKSKLPKPKAKKFRDCVVTESCVIELREKLGVDKLVFVSVAKKKRKPFAVQLRVAGEAGVTELFETQVKKPKKLVGTVKGLGQQALAMKLEPQGTPEASVAVAASAKDTVEPAAKPETPVLAESSADASEGDPVIEPAAAAPTAEPVAEPGTVAPTADPVVAEASFTAKPVKQDLEAALTEAVTAPKVPTPELAPPKPALGEQVDDSDPTVHAGSYKIETAADLMALEKIKTVDGSLTVRASGLVTLNGLETLQAITGDLVVDGCSALTSFRGLKGLRTVGRNMVIRGNGSLMTLTGLGRLTQVGGGIRIQGNTALIDLNALKRLSRIGSDLDISDNDSLGSLAGLGGLTEVGGYVSVSGNEVLPNLRGLQRVSVIGKDLLVQQNTSLKTLEGLGKLREVGGHLTIYENEYLQDVSQLGTLQKIRGDVRIDSNTSLPACNVDKVRSTLGAAAPSREVLIRGTAMVGKCN